MTDTGTFVVLCAAAFAAGAMNAVAGGGTLLTFPALTAVVPPVIANATSTVALVPGSLAGAWGYRHEMGTARRWVILLLVPSLVGGGLGSLLVTRLDECYFTALVPWLILVASLLFLLQPWITHWSGIGQPHATPGRGSLAGVIVFQFLVAIYGGYFGAGIGILMLSALGLMGIADIHRMNAVKTFLAACINGVSVVIFVVDDKVAWHYAPVMAGASIAGGYFGARTARRLSRTLVRWTVIAIGFGLAGYYFVKQMSS
jgi:uncharacterized membrane protein YfcA